MCVWGGFVVSPRQADAWVDARVGSHSDCTLVIYLPTEAASKRDRRRKATGASGGPCGASHSKKAKRERGEEEQAASSESGSRAPTTGVGPHVHGFQWTFPGFQRKKQRKSPAGSSPKGSACCR